MRCIALCILFIVPLSIRAESVPCLEFGKRSFAIHPDKIAFHLDLGELKNYGIKLQLDGAENTFVLSWKDPPRRPKPIIRKEWLTDRSLVSHFHEDFFRLQNPELSNYWYVLRQNPYHNFELIGKYNVIVAACSYPLDKPSQVSCDTRYTFDDITLSFSYSLQPAEVHLVDRKNQVIKKALKGLEASCTTDQANE